MYNAFLNIKKPKQSKTALFYSQTLKVFSGRCPDRQNFSLSLSEYAAKREASGSDFAAVR